MFTACLSGNWPKRYLIVALTSRVVGQHITTHANKGAAGNVLGYAHHTASPGAKRRQRRKTLRVRFSSVGHANRH